MVECRKLEEYDKAMQDPVHRAAMERTAPLTAEEESRMYALMDKLAAANDEPLDETG